MSKIYVKDVLRVASKEIGYMEKASNKDLDNKTANAGNGNYTKYARDLWDADPHFYQGPKNGYDWCTVFVDWCIYEACGNDAVYAQAAKHYTGPYGAGCDFAANYYKAANAWYTNNPKPGDQIFLNDYNHTGIVERVEDGRVYTIEGNSANMVSRRSYAVSDSRIDGYGRPKYDGQERPEACHFVDVPSGAWYHNAVVWAYENGITAGTDPTHFSPDKSCSRAELVQMLYKMQLATKGGV